MRAAYRVLAFVAKEIKTIFLQPQLILLLVAGPFLVLLAFGVGYRPQGPELRTIVVQPQPDDPRQAIGFYLSAVGPPLKVTEVTPDLGPALRQLQGRQVDLVVVVPPGVRDTLLAGHNVRLVFYHNAIDPARIGYITAVIDGATSQLNRAIAKVTVGQQQASAADYAEILRQLQNSLAGIQSALQQNDRQRALELSQAVRINSELVGSLWLFAAEPFSEPAAPSIQLTEQARQLESQLASPGTGQGAEATIGKMHENVGRMLQVLDRTQEIPPDVLVSPLAWEAKGVSAYQPGYVAYHSPTVLALLVQHLCITLAALSLVDERSAGAIELFRAAPVRPREILMGKFVAYVLVITVTVLALVGLLVYGLRIPLLGDWRWLAMALAALMADSLSLGFMISALANSRSQAIQMSMLVLLGSIFFSGFFMPLEDFVLPVRLFSYSLPVTYGVQLLRQIVLRGEPPQMLFLGLLTAWAVFLGLLSVVLFRRLFLAR